MGHMLWLIMQGSKIVLVRSYLRVSQAAGQVNILIFLLKIKFSPCMPINFVMQGKCLFSDISRPVMYFSTKGLCKIERVNPFPECQYDGFYIEYTYFKQKKIARTKRKVTTLGTWDLAEVDPWLLLYVSHVPSKETIITVHIQDFISHQRTPYILQSPPTWEVGTFRTEFAYVYP